MVRYVSVISTLKRIMFVLNKKGMLIVRAAAVPASVRWYILFWLWATLSLGITGNFCCASSNIYLCKSLQATNVWTKPIHCKSSYSIFFLNTFYSFLTITFNFSVKQCFKTFSSLSWRALMINGLLVNLCRL